MQTETMHTPGPWRPTELYALETTQPFMIWCDERGAAIAHVFRRSEAADGIGHAEQHANAKLIAAAPDLLAALRRWESWYIQTGAPEALQGIARDASAAILKATT